MPGVTSDEDLRDLARHRGFKLVKSRRRKPGVGDYGRYGLADAKTGSPCFGIAKDRLTATAEEVEDYLRGRAKSDWKSSLSVAGEARPPRVAPRRVAPAEQEPTVRSRPRRAATAPAKPAPHRPERSATVRPLRSVPKEEPAPPPKPSLVIRDATKQDGRTIIDLLEETDTAPPSAAALGRTIERLAKQGTPVLVADQGGVVGCASYQLISTLSDRAPLGRITILLVGARMRRRGIGTALLRSAEERLQAQGCGAIELVTAIELSNANSFLRHHGYARSGYRFAKEYEAK